MSDRFLNVFFDPVNFRRAWKKVTDNHGCAGVDGETSVQFAVRAEENLTKLRKMLLTGKYRPLPLLQFFIPKKSGGLVMPKACLGCIRYRVTIRFGLC
jgi:CRISPR-associated protein Cas1